MIHDEELRSQIDYSAGQREAAKRVLIELVGLFHEYEDELRIVGGWVPDLLFPEAGHVGSVDVDVLINHITLQDTGYLTMSKILLKNGYKEHPEKYFSFVKTVCVCGEDYDVDVDILAGMYGGTQEKKRSQHVQGMKALKATGGNFAFSFDPNRIRLEGHRTDGALDIAHVNVIAVVPYLVMKTAALGRGKAKDAYDIYFLISHYHGGYKLLAQEFKEYAELEIIKKMMQKLNEKFMSPRHTGPMDVSDFMELETESEEAMGVRADAYAQIQALLDEIKKIQVSK